MVTISKYFEELRLGTSEHNRSAYFTWLSPKWGRGLGDACLGMWGCGDAGRGDAWGRENRDVRTGTWDRGCQNNDKYNNKNINNYEPMNLVLKRF